MVVDTVADDVDPGLPDVIVLEILEDEPIAVTGEEPLTEMVEMDLVIFGTLADVVDQRFLVDEPITGLDKSLDKVDGLDFLGNGLDIVTGVVSILLSVVWDFADNETFDVEPNEVLDLKPVVIKDIIAKGPSDFVVEKPDEVTEAGPVTELRDDLWLLVDVEADDIELWLVVEAEALVKPLVNSVENDADSEIEVFSCVEELEAIAGDWEKVLAGDVETDDVDRDAIVDLPVTLVSEIIVDVLGSETSASYPSSKV